MISVIIPALNEEEYLPRLLQSLQEQKYIKEIIIADANSSDDTLKVAKSFGCKIAEGGLPSKGRNNAANSASGELLLFLDADVVLPNDFVNKIVNEFHKKKLDIATCPIAPLRFHLFDSAIFWINKILLRISPYVYPAVPGCCILVKKNIHHKLNGFDESLVMAEDLNYGYRASKIGKLRTLRSTNILMSMRRFEKEGRVRLLMCYLYCFFYRLLCGEVRREIFKVKLGGL